MDKKRAGRKPGKKSITMELDRELYDFFSEYAEKERDTMAGILRRYILSLMKQQQAAEQN